VFFFNPVSLLQDKLTAAELLQGDLNVAKLS